MNKLSKIIEREYFSRVKSKSFIITTILTPLAIAALLFGSILISDLSKDKDNLVLVLDEAGITSGSLAELNSNKYTYTNSDYEGAKSAFENQDVHNIFVHIPPLQDSLENKIQASYLSKQKIGIHTITNLEEDMSVAFKEFRIQASKIPEATINSFNVTVRLENAEFLEEKDAKGDSKIKTIIGTAIGAVIGFMMYLVIILYGSMIMRSVMEEKVNRIVEVIISSVKPFQLMLGKLVGVGLVGLTQLVFWLILIPIIFFLTQLIMGPFDPSSLSGVQMNPSAAQEQLSSSEVAQVLVAIKSLNWMYIIPVFIIYFLGGFFMYAALFAAVGSAIGDDMGESQSLMMPIMLPVIIALMLLFPVLENPQGNMAVWASIFPLFSPIIMPARLVFEPPIWQVLLSVVLLIVSVIGAIWVTGKIYRVGILLYGKKITFKEITRWVFTKS